MYTSCKLECSIKFNDRPVTQVYARKKKNGLWRSELNGSAGLSELN